MRIPRSLAWALLLAGFLTAGLLRTFHPGTPRSPFVPPVVGSLLFACLLFLLLVSARERRVGPAPGHGIRLGSVTPLLLLLLLEKWASINLYRPVFALLAGSGTLPDGTLDAAWRTFAAAGLFAVVLVGAGFSPPAGRGTWESARPGRFPAGAGLALLGIGVAYALLAGIAAATGNDRGLRLGETAAPYAWVVASQVSLAAAEELYYRGLLLRETFRLLPRLGIRGEAPRRWIALALPSALFAVEHLDLAADPAILLRSLLFAFALGLVFGLVVLATGQLFTAWAIHAWINLLLLGAAPRIETAGEAVYGPGLYIAIALSAVVVLLFVFRRSRP